MSDYVCEELLVDIFKRLPIKTLIRFRSVSKLWCSCISRVVLIRMRTPHKVLIQDEVYHGYNEFKDMFTEISGSCNEILRIRDLIDGESYICHLNFLVRSLLTLPDHPSLRDCISVPDVVYGFGFDPISYDYKIVAIWYSHDKGTIHASYVYSMKTCSWTEIAFPTIPIYSVKSPACFFNGLLYWVVISSLRNLTSDRLCFLLTFNLSTHVFVEVYSSEFCWKTTQVIIYDGSLAFTSRKRDTIWIWGISENEHVGRYFLHIATLKRDRFDMISGLQPTTEDDLSFNTFNNGLRLLKSGPYCYGETIFREKKDEKKLIRLSFPSIPI